MSKLYIDIIKDRLYCDKKDSLSRRSAQTVLYIILNGLCKLLSPVLSYTMEETWEYIAHTDKDNAESVFFNDMPSFVQEYSFPEIEEKYEKLFGFRDDVMKALENARAEKSIGKSLEAKVKIYADESNEAMKLFREFSDMLETVFIVSEVELSNEKAPENAFKETQSGIAVETSVSEGEKCVRCWIQIKDAEHDEDGQPLCKRCKKAVS